MLALRRPGEGVELGIAGMGHPGGGARVVAARTGARHSAGGHSATWRTRRSAGGGSGRAAARIGGAELPLVVDDPGLGARLVVGGGSDVVVAVGWVLGE